MRLTLEINNDGDSSYLFGQGYLNAARQKGF
jgi:hypothetical protein